MQLYSALGTYNPAGIQSFIYPRDTLESRLEYIGILNPGDTLESRQLIRILVS
jgi:hypothetical protein